MTFRVDMNEYCGPMELLLYLVRREELPLSDLSLAKLTEQYLDYLEVLTELSIDDVADFLEIASVLIEMKAKAILPQSPVAVDEEAIALEDPSDQLIQRLMDYKRIRDAAAFWTNRGSVGSCVTSDWPTICHRAARSSTSSLCRRSRFGIWSVHLAGFSVSGNRRRRRKWCTTTRRSTSIWNVSMGPSTPTAELN